ncbi:MAG: hypothetical protein ACOY0T_10270 [Myxococcota bacterium]
MSTGGGSVRAVQPKSEPRRGRSFRIVALIFMAVLVLGLVAGFIVYRKYVAYEPKVAAHVPAMARAALRVDLTHVMFYEPFRRSLFPVADRFAQGVRSRRERLDALGVRVNSDIREVLALQGPGANDWALVLGGRLPRGLVARSLAAVLREEGRQVKEASGTYSLPETGLAFAEAADGAFVLASSEAALAPALVVGQPDPILAAGSGGVVVRNGTLPPPLGALTASFRAGSTVEIRGRVEASANSPMAEALIRTLLQTIAGSDAAANSAIQGIELTRDSSGIAFRLGLPREAVLGVIELLSQRIPG